MCSGHSILECYNLFSGVELNIRSFCFIPGKNRQFTYYFKTMRIVYVNSVFQNFDLF